MGISNCYDGTGNLLNLPGEPGEGGVMDDELKRYVTKLHGALRTIKFHIMQDEHPNVIAIAAAKRLVDAYEFEDCYHMVPDWLNALANGNPEMWDDVVEEVRHLIRFDEKKAQS